MYTYTYTQEDFANASILDSSNIQEKITLLALISATIQYIDTSGEGITLVMDMYFDTELSIEDKVILDDFVTNYTDVPNGIICTLKDIKTPGTNGGTFEQDDWITRELNVIEGLVSFVSLEDNQVTIQPGSYIINIKAPSCGVESNQIRLRNITDSTYTLGTNTFSTDGNMTYSELNDHFVFDHVVTFDVQHICSQTNDGVGFGRAVGFNANEVYSTVFIQKLS